MGRAVQIAGVSESVAAQTLQSCLSRGVREFVVCAGARNAPLVMALLGTEGLQVWSHFEERGAGFFALGRTMATGAPVAVVTTSGYSRSPRTAPPASSSATTT